MRICLLLPRFSPTSLNPPCRVIRKFNHSYQVGLATAASALAQGHEVNCVLVGPDPAADADGCASIDPAVRNLQSAFPGKMNIGLAEPPEPEAMQNYIDGISDPRGARHWAQAINGASEPGVHVIIDAVGAEVCGGCKYLLAAPEFNANDEQEETLAQHLRRSNSGHMWSRFDFPDSDGLVRAVTQVYASNKLVSALSSSEALLRRAPEPSVIPPSVRDASKVKLPLHMQQANPCEAGPGAQELLDADSEQEYERLNKKLKKQEKILERHMGKKPLASEIEVKQQEEEEEEDEEFFPEDTLVLSLVSWRLLSIAEWHVKRVLWLPQYNGGDRSEVCVAACEDIYRYFTEMFRQQTFDDFSFLAVPPLLREGIAEKAKSGTDLLALSAMRSRSTRLSLKKESLPFEMFRFSGLLPITLQARAVGVAAAMSNTAPGFSSYVCADEVADTIVDEIEQYLEDDRDIRSEGVYNLRGILEEKRNKEKDGGKLRLASKLRFGFTGRDDDEMHKGDIAVQKNNPLSLIRHAYMLERMYNTFDDKK